MAGVCKCKRECECEIEVLLLNCDETCNLKPASSLFSSENINIKNWPWKIRERDQVIQQLHQHREDLQKDCKLLGVFVVHAHESRLNINEEHSGVGYYKVFQALKKATDDNVIVVVQHDETYQENEKMLLSPTIRRKLRSQFSKEEMHGPKGYVFSWNNEPSQSHREIANGMVKVMQQNTGHESKKRKNTIDHTYSADKILGGDEIDQDVTSGGKNEQANIVKSNKRENSGDKNKQIDGKRGDELEEEEANRNSKMEQDASSAVKIEQYASNADKKEQDNESSGDKNKQADGKKVDKIEQDDESSGEINDQADDAKRGDKLEQEAKCNSKMEQDASSADKMEQDASNAYKMEEDASSADKMEEDASNADKMEQDASNADKMEQDASSADKMEQANDDFVIIDPTEIEESKCVLNDGEQESHSKKQKEKRDDALIQKIQNEHPGKTLLAVFNGGGQDQTLEIILGSMEILGNPQYITSQNGPLMSAYRQAGKEDCYIAVLQNDKSENSYEVISKSDSSLTEEKKADIASKEVDSHWTQADTSCLSNKTPQDAQNTSTKFCTYSQQKNHPYTPSKIDIDEASKRVNQELPGKRILAVFNVQTYMYKRPNFVLYTGSWNLLGKREYLISENGPLMTVYKQFGKKDCYIAAVHEDDGSRTYKVIPKRSRIKTIFPFL